MAQAINGNYSTEYEDAIKKWGVSWDGIKIDG
jgi:hypothetical protein